MMEAISAAMACGVCMMFYGARNEGRKYMPLHRRMDVWVMAVAPAMLTRLMDEPEN